MLAGSSIYAGNVLDCVRRVVEKLISIPRRAVEVSRAQSTVSKVTSKHIMAVIAEMQNSPTAAYLRECSLHERIMLAATWKCLKREGVSIVKWADVRFFYLPLTYAPNDLIGGIPARWTCHVPGE